MNLIVGEGQGFGSFEKDESKINGVAEPMNRSEGANRVPAGPEVLQPQGPAIHWKRFLLKKSLKVLVVENDDSTRHVVSALLQNCGYEVTAVANGLQAWRILEDMTNHVDLVLTEVVMPIISGIDFLRKIMSHKTFKNIPVIMMSHLDSMGLVFRCLSKGAVDFLVKPVRKNELKNLWQHVWRRCRSSSGSGSGSESGPESKISASSKGNDESKNNTGSSDEHANGSIGLSIQGGSDNGSGTQISWTKRAAEVDRPISSWRQLPVSPDSFCAQFVYPKPETSSSRRVHVAESKEPQEQDKKLENFATSEDMEISAYGNSNAHIDCQLKLSTRPTQYKLSKLDSLPFERETPEHISQSMSANQKDCFVDLNIGVASCAKPQVESQAIEAPKDLSQTKDKSTCQMKESSPLEPTLMLRGAGNLGTTLRGDHNALRHSYSSAFSKYNTASSTSQTPTGNVGSCSPPDNSSVPMKTEITHNTSSTPPNQQLIAPKATDQVQAGGPNQQVQVQHHHHYHHHHHYVLNMKHQFQLDGDDHSLKNMVARAVQCGLSDVVGGSREVNAGYCSTNGSGSGGKHGSNEMNGSGNSGVIGLTGKVSGSEADEERLTQRQAALIKFLQKRKERSFEKKVRYQTRKRLAEQRPRIKGKFVRHIGSDTNLDSLGPDQNSCESVQLH